MLATNKTSVELLLPIGEDCVVEVRATTDGGDGASSEQVRIPGITGESPGRHFLHLHRRVVAPHGSHAAPSAPSLSVVCPLPVGRLQLRRFREQDGEARSTVKADRQELRGTRSRTLFV